MSFLNRVAVFRGLRVRSLDIRTELGKKATPVERSWLRWFI